jgi:hypothetical protein
VTADWNRPEIGKKCPKYLGTSWAVVAAVVNLMAYIAEAILGISLIWVFNLILDSVKRTQWAADSSVSAKGRIF